jgi:trimeric autotransporter adhesin
MSTPSHGRLAGLGRAGLTLTAVVALASVAGAAQAAQAPGHTVHARAAAQAPGRTVHARAAAQAPGRTVHGRAAAAAAPTISTFAGGVGGPAKATTVTLSGGSVTDVDPCGLAVGNGALYVGDTTTVRRIGPADGLTTPAGSGALSGYPASGVPAVGVLVSYACGVATDSSGNLVIADSGARMIRVVAAKTGTFYGQAMTAGDIYTVAGTGLAGFYGDGGPARAAYLNIPDDVAVDHSGNLVIADTGNDRVRVVAIRTGTFYGQAMTAGDIYTIAGNGQQGFSGNGGPATEAALDYPESVAVDANGNLLIADLGNNRVRVVAAKTGTFYGQAMTAGDIYTIAGTGERGYSGDGGPATAAKFSAPYFVTVDAAGNVVISDLGNQRVRVVAPKTGTFYGQSMTAGDVYTVAGDGTAGFAGDGGPATAAELYAPTGVAVDSAGNLYIADRANGRVRMVPAQTGSFYGQSMTAHDIYTIAGVGAVGSSGDHGPATKAEFNLPSSVAVDAHGNAIIADSNSDLVRAVAASTGTFYGQAMTAGDVYTVAGNGTAGFSGNGGLATAAELDLPLGVSADAAGDLLIADTDNQRVRLVAARTGTLYGQAMTAGHIYTIAGDGTAGYSGDGGPATAAELNVPGWAVADGAGNVIIADTGNNRVRVLAAKTGTFYGQAMTAGHIYTVAGDGTAGYSGDGGPATAAELNAPGGLTVDPAGNLVIADTENDRVRVVAGSTGTFYGQAMTAGHIYTVAGGGPSSGLGDGGPATEAALAWPGAVAIDGSGNLLIADTLDYQVRVVATSTGTFYGQAMTAGDIYALAGDGTPGFSGDGGPAAAAELDEPSGVAVESGGGVLIADEANGRIRLVS